MSTSYAVPAPVIEHAAARALVTRSIFKQAMVDAFLKLAPQQQWKNPVMFVVYLGSFLTTILWAKRRPVSSSL